MTAGQMLLLVEDEALVRHDLKENLIDAGFEVMDFGDGEPALSAFEADPARFKALILDVKLRKDPDGWEIARRAREIAPKLPVIYVTGHGLTDWPSKGIPRSVIIGKPFAPAQIVTAVSMLLSETDAV